MSQLKKGAILSYLKIGLTNIIGLILTPFIIKSLGDSEYGLYTLIGSIVVYLSLMDFGLNNTIIRFIAKYRTKKDLESEKEFLGSIFLIYFVISFCVIIIGTLANDSLAVIFSESLTSEEVEKAQTMFQILVFNIAIILPGGAFTAICNAYESFVWPRLIAIIKYISRATLIFALLSMGGDSITLVIIDTVLNIVVILITSFYVFRHLKINVSFKSIKIELVKEIFNYTIWIFLLAITSHFLWNAGQIILGIKTNTETVAYYAVGILLGGYYASFSGAISSLFLPRATQMSIESSKKDILIMMIKIGRLSLIVLLFILTSFFLFGKEFIYWWVGDKYDSSYTIALIIMIVYTVPLILNFANSLIEAYDKVRYKVIVYMIFFTAGLGLGYLLIPQLKEIGMIIGLGLGWIIAQLIMIVFYHNKLELNMILFFKNTFRGFLLPILVIVSLSFVLNLFLPTGFIYLFIKMIAYALIYWFIMYVYTMNSYERTLVKSKLIK